MAHFNILKINKNSAHAAYKKIFVFIFNAALVSMVWCRIHVRKSEKYLHNSTHIFHSQKKKRKIENLRKKLISEVKIIF